MIKTDQEIDCLLMSLYEQCNEENRSTEYTIQFMQDMADVSHECVLKWLRKNSEE